ncbi:Uncharacterised protein [Salmonella enterica subsp. enterica]|nr:Uncharacterised protein [Salmonella enterica subsp. enterica]
MVIFYDPCQNTGTGDISTFIDLCFFKLVNNQEKFYRQNKRNERGADKINDPGRDKTQIIIFNSIIQDAPDGPNNNCINKKLCRMERESFLPLYVTAEPKSHDQQRHTATEKYRQIKCVFEKKFSEHYCFPLLPTITAQNDLINRYFTQDKRVDHR